MSELSLVNIVRNDPDFNKRITKKVAEIKADRENINSTAQRYADLYKDEIAAGTEKRAKLLTEGKSRGMTEEEVLCGYGKFLPSIYTPVLNMLYFLLRESEEDPYYGKKHYTERDRINEAMVETNKMVYSDEKNLDGVDLTDDEAEKLLSEFIDDTFAPQSSEARKSINEVFENEEENETSLKDPEAMEEYLFGHLTIDQFCVLKKLKSLTKSNNLNESSLAFKKGKELSLKLGIDWDKVPDYYEKKK